MQANDPVHLSESDVELPLRVIPLGGLGEIGLNAMVFEYGETLVLVDAGLMFPEDSMLGVDVVIPDFSYLRENRERFKALIVTHGHEDHIGAIPFLLREFDVPVYGTPLTLALIEEKLREHRLTERGKRIPVHPRETVEVGEFRFEFIRVCHSIPDGVGLAIHTPLGVLIHSGDFKIDHTPIDGRRFDHARFGEYGERGVLALFSDSTNVERRGYTLSERRIGDTLRDIFRRCRGRIVVAIFSSNLHRIQEVVRLAAEFNRKVLLNGKSIVNNVRIGRELGYLDFPPEDEAFLREVQDLPDERLLMLTTGSQGEPMSALTRMAFNSHAKLKVKPGDTVILSSKSIPGNERAIQHIINNLYRQGAEVLYDQVVEVHVSGHAHREELKTMLSLVRPRYFIPIHGEYRHLVKHRQLAIDTGIDASRCLLAEDGQVIAFRADGVEIEGRVDTGRIFVDGKGVGDVGGMVLRDRRHLSEAGMVIASLVLRQDTLEILRGPDILSSGFTQQEAKPELFEEAEQIVLRVVDFFRKEPIKPDATELQEHIRRDLRRYFNRTLERRPVVHPVVITL